MQKILLIVHDYFPNFFGGTEGYTHDLAHSLSDIGYEVMIYAQELGSKEKQELETEEYIEDGKVKVFKVHRAHGWSKTRLKDTVINPDNDEIFRKVIKDFAPDIVHVNQLIYNSLSLIDIVKENNIPLVYTVHDLWFRCPMVRGYLNDGPCLCTDEKASGTCSAIVIGGDPMVKLESMWARFIARLDWRNQRIKRNKITRDYLLKADQLIVPSDYLRKEVESFIKNKKEVIKIQHGTKVPPKELRKNIVNKDEVIFLFSSIAISKGFGILIDTFKEISDKYDNFKLLVAGKYVEGDPHLDKYMNMLDEMKNGEYIGPYKPDEKYNIFSKANVGIVPSVWDEIYGLVLDEALAMNRFVVVSNRGALSERVTDNKNGFIFDPDIEGDFYNKIATILENPEEVIDEKIIKENKTWRSQKEHVEEILEVYKKVLDE